MAGRIAVAVATADETDTDGIANRASAVVADAFESIRRDYFGFHRRADDVSGFRPAAVAADNSPVHRTEPAVDQASARSEADYSDTSAAYEVRVHAAAAVAAAADSVASNGLAAFLRKFNKLRTRMGNDDANQLGIKQLAKSND